jgi:hypothetical protein
MDKKGKGQVCPPFAMKEKPLVDGTPYDEWKKLPSGQQRMKKGAYVTT